MLPGNWPDNGRGSLPKKKIEKPQREATRRQISRWQRENRLQRFIFLGGVIVIAAVLIVVGTGIFLDKFAPLREIALKVSGTDANYEYTLDGAESISMVYSAGETTYNVSYYIDALEYYGKANYEFFQQYGFDYGSTLSYIASSVAQDIQENQFLKEAAAALDPPVTVSDEEIKEFMKEYNHPDTQAARDAIYATLLQDKLEEYFDKKVPAEGEQRAVLAMFLESRQQLEEVKARLAKGENFRDLAGELSTDSTTQTKDGDLGWVPKGVLPSILGDKTNTVLENLIFAEGTTTGKLVQAEDKERTKSVGYWLLKITEREVVEPTPTATPSPAETDTPEPDETATPTPEGTPRAHVWAMLLSSKAQAEQILAQLENGADFTTLAKANSSHTNASTNGGDLGLLSKDEVISQLGSAATAVIFPEDSTQELPLNTVSDPIEDTAKITKGGYWLAQVTGIEENKAIEGDNRTTLMRNLKQGWTDQVWSENSARTQNLLTQEQTSYAVVRAVERGV